MGKFLLSTLLLLTTAFASTAETWKSTATTAADWDKILTGSSATTTSAPTAWKGTSNNLEASWTMAYTWQNTGKIYYTRGKNGLQFGSSNAGVKTMTLSTTNIPGKIISVKIMGVKSNGSANLSVTVGMSAYTYSSSESYKATSNPTDVTFSGNSSGNITIDFTGNANGKYIGLSGLEITYDTTYSEDPTKCGTPVAKIDGVTVENGGKYFVNDELTLSCTPQDATIKYSLSGDEFEDLESTYLNPIKLTKAGNYILTATAIKDQMKDSEELELSFSVSKREAGISFAKSTATAYLDAAFSAPELLNPNNLKGISYTSSNTEIATVAADGTVTPLAAGETTITAKFTENEQYNGGESKYVLTVEAVKPLMEEIVINKFFDGVTNSAYTKYIKESDIADYTTVVSWSNSTCFWNTKNTNGGENSGLIVKSQKGYYPVKITVESNYSNNNTFNVYASDSELTLSTLKDCKEISALTTDNRTYNFTRDFAYIGLRPSAANAVKIEKITIVYAPRPEAPVFAEGHGIDESGVLSTSDDSKDLFFVPMENAEIYYRLTAKAATNALADEATDEIHGDFTKLEDHTKAINVTKDHSSLEYYSYVNGVKSNVNKVTLDLGNSATGVAEIEAAGAGEVRWFDMQGREVKGQPEKGIYVRVANGKASKVIL